MTEIIRPRPSEADKSRRSREAQENATDARETVRLFLSGYPEERRPARLSALLAAASAEHGSIDAAATVSFLGKLSADPGVRAENLARASRRQGVRAVFGGRG